MGQRRISGRPSKRRWLRYGIIIGLLLLVVVVYETGQQLRRSGAGSDDQASAPDIPRAGDTLRRVKSYYRSHDLPAGWEVGATARGAAGRIEVVFHFAPGIRSSRHGEAARSGEIGPHNACPTGDSGLWGTLAEPVFEIVINDKTGVIDRIACTPPSRAE